MSNMFRPSRCHLQVNYACAILIAQTAVPSFYGKIFGPKMDGINERFSVLNNEMLPYLYRISSALMIKFRGYDGLGILIE